MWKFNNLEIGTRLDWTGSAPWARMIWKSRTGSPDGWSSG